MAKTSAKPTKSKSVNGTMAVRLSGAKGKTAKLAQQQGSPASKGRDEGPARIDRSARLQGPERLERQERPLRPERAPRPELPPATGLGLNRTIADGVSGLHYELIEIERAPRGLLRVTIDRRPGQVYDTGPSEFITVEDCERVTRQLQYALEVEAVDYARLEVSSPGLDRPLKTEADYHRFTGLEVNVTFKLPFEGRKNWRGLLQHVDGAWSLRFLAAKIEQVLGFTLDEVREARLVPVVDFKGRKAAAPLGSSGMSEMGSEGDASPGEPEVDGGMDQ